MHEKESQYHLPKLFLLSIVKLNQNRNSFYNHDSLCKILLLRYVKEWTILTFKELLYHFMIQLYESLRGYQGRSNEWMDNEHSFICSFNKYRLSTHDVSGTTLGPEVTSVKSFTFLG